MRLLRTIIWTLALVAFWASAEQGAFTEPPVRNAMESARQDKTASPRNSWEKLQALFAPVQSETEATTLQKGR